MFTWLVLIRVSKCQEINTKTIDFGKVNYRTNINYMGNENLNDKNIKQSDCNGNDPSPNNISQEMNIEVEKIT